MTKCLKIGCDKEAKPGFECCSAQHGADVNWVRKDIERISDADNQHRADVSFEELNTYLAL